MKKLISITACLVAAVSVLVSCQPKAMPDGKCELTGFYLPASLNSDLAADIFGTIDASAKTITLVIPTSVTASRFTPIFTATEHDVVSIGGTPATSGETAVTITDGTKISVSDEVSALNASYTVVVKQNDEQAELTGVIFKKADNGALTDDVSPEAIAPEMVVRVPGAAFKQELVMTVSAGFNDAIKVNNETVENGASIKVDTSFPIDIAVTDEVAGKTVNYVVKVGKILEVVVTKLGSYAEGTINDFTMTLSPTDQLPYFAYTRKLDGESNWGVSVAKWNGSAFTLVGKTGLADASARSASKSQVAFAKDGTLYVYYLGGDVASKPTVKKLDSDWVTIGTAGITAQNCNSTYYNSFFVHPDGSQPAFLWAGNSKNTASYRKMNYTYRSGEEWNTVTESSGIPIYESGTALAYYTSAVALTDTKAFLVSTFNGAGYYVHEVGKDGTLTSIAEGYLPDGAPYGLASSLQMKKGVGESLYFLGANCAGDRSMQIFSIDQSGKAVKTYGSAIPATISASGGVTGGFTFGINPVSGLTVYAYSNKDEAPVIAYLDDNLQWSNFTVDVPLATATTCFADFDKDGNGYIAYQSADGITLLKVGLEADILPE